MENEELLHRVEVVLTEVLGELTVLANAHILKEGARSKVLRCSVEVTNSPYTSVIVKQFEADTQRGFTEWTSLKFLTSLTGAADIVPYFLGGNVDERFFVLQDLGPARNLQDLLVSSNSPELLNALRDLAKSMARISAASQGYEPRFLSELAALPLPQHQDRESEAQNWLHSLPKLLAWFEAFNCQPPSGFDQTRLEISELFKEPEEFLAFSHGDPAPSNNHFGPDRAHLLDFEYGGYRHALYDITAWQVLCPLPLDYVEEMKSSFQKELGKTCPAARDAARFEREWAYLCAYRTLAILTWIPTDILVEDQPWADHWSMRRAVLVATSRLEKLCEPWPGLEPIGRAMSLLLKGMRGRWTEFDDAESLLPVWKTG